MKTILVALDGSPAAIAVLEQAVELGRATGARLVLARVVGLPVELPHEALSQSPENLATILEGLARTQLAALAEAVPRELSTQLRVELGSPWQGILHAARDEQADLIVIGSHGHSVLDRLLGTTVSRVLSHADRSVLVVRPRS
jgi:nucleotide-binding universal stress UspA family protein